MASVATPKKRIRKIGISLVIIIAVLSIFFLLFINRIVEPILRQRLHTLIVQGSDSLYQYNLGALNANFLGGSFEVENLHIKIDSNRYKQLDAAHALPALTLQLDLVRGQIKGIGITDLLLHKQINIKEIISKDANIVLLRHIQEDDAPKTTEPLWKSIQPAINSIAINRVKLDGVKLLYKNADTAHAVKLQFDKCLALFEDIKVDSASSVDTARLGFTRYITMQFNDLKFRTPDSTYKLKSEVITYSSKTQTLELQEFKMQPTLEERDVFYKAINRRKLMNVIELAKIQFTRFRLDHFINNNIIAADSVLIDKPKITIYNDKTYPPDYESKVGRYPQQLLLKSNSTIKINAISVRSANLKYTERSEVTKQEGILTLKDMDIAITNLTNDSNTIKQNGKCIAMIKGSILESSPINALFTFHLDSANGRFDVAGTVKNVTAKALNGITEPLANTYLQSLNLHNIAFNVRGDNYTSSSNVQMTYDNLFVVLRKKVEETGNIKTKKFLTKILNKFTIYAANPVPGGQERIATNANQVRLTSQGFFGVLWKAIFAGMQNIIVKS
ncbi:MAG TPA: hypothetical protein VM888_14085, partial [Chitinophagaceae bacterium]|nr:hypothetical protein [Chitinophagaceae bacterium]